MFSQHPDIPFPEDDKTPIWRYLSFAQLVDLLDSSTLYFCRLDAFDDPFEGHTTQLDYFKRWLPQELLRIATHSEAAKAAGGKLERWWATKTKETEQENLIRVIQNFHYEEMLWINCWHVGEDDNAVFWRTYAGFDKDIAIRSTVGALRDSVAADSAYRISIGCVDYVNDPHLAMKWRPGLRAALAKTKSFASEREVRAILRPGERSALDFGTGIKVAVDKRTLVDGIFISPRAQDWLYDLTQRVARTYYLDAPCHKSDFSAKRAHLPVKY